MKTLRDQRGRFLSRTDTVTLPAYWASALINGDYSGLPDDAECMRCVEARAALLREGWHIVDCEEESRFTWNYQLYDAGADCSGGDVLDYTLSR